MRYILAYLTVTILSLMVIGVVIGAYFISLWCGLGSTALTVLLTGTVISLESGWIFSSGFGISAGGFVIVKAMLIGRYLLKKKNKSY